MAKKKKINGRANVETRVVIEGGKHRHPLQTLFTWVVILALIAGLGYSGWYGWQFKESYDLHQQAKYLMQTNNPEGASQMCAAMTVNSAKCFYDIVVRLEQQGVLVPELCAAIDLDTLAYWERTAATKAKLSTQKQQCISQAQQAPPMEPA